MKLLYEKDNKQHFLLLLKFYWAFYWRVVTLGVAVIVAIDVPMRVTTGDRISDSIILTHFVFLITCIYIIKRTSLLKYKTFKVIWTSPIPKNILSKRFFYPAFVFSILPSGVSLYVERFAQLSFSTDFCINLVCEIFLLHIFILNNWLPFQLIPLNRQDEPAKSE